MESLATRERKRFFLSPERFYMETRDSEDECAENSGA